MRHFLYLFFPLWIILTAGCFAFFASEFSDFGFEDKIYGDFLGWITFCFITLINAIVTFSARWCYQILKYYTWLTLFLALLILSNSWIKFDVSIAVIGVNFIFCILGGRELWLTLRHKRLSGKKV